MQLLPQPIFEIFRTLSATNKHLILASRTGFEPATNRLTAVFLTKGRDSLLQCFRNCSAIVSQMLIKQPRFYQRFNEQHLVHLDR